MIWPHDATGRPAGGGGIELQKFGKLLNCKLDWEFIPNKLKRFMGYLKKKKEEEKKVFRVMLNKYYITSIWIGDWAYNTYIYLNF